MTTKIQPNPSDSRFTAGDLVYIPQDVQLWAWGEGSVINTPAPTTGIFIEEKELKEISTSNAYCLFYSRK